MSDLRRWSAQLLERAKGAGASWVEIAIQETTTRVCAGRRDAGRLEGPETLLTVRLGLDDGRVGAVGRLVTAEAQGGALVDQALSLARQAAPDPFEGPAERMDLPTQGLQISDPRLPRLEETDRRDVIAYNEDAARSVSRSVVLGGFVYEELAVRRCVLTSRGQDGLENGSRFRLRGAVRAPGGAGPEVSGLVESRRFADVASMPMGGDLARRALALASPASWPERRMPLVLEPRVLAVLLPVLAMAFDGDRVARGQSFLRSDALDASQEVGSTRLHLVDDACLPGALATRAFDDRGVPPMPLPLIREGTLGALYRSPRSARSRGTRPTGHTRADGSPWPGTLVVRPGSRSRNMMFPDVGRYLLIDEILDLSGVDLASGALRLPVRVALGEQGQVLGGLGEAALDTTITGLFGAIQEMASDTERHGSVDACTWVLEGLSLLR